MTVGFNGASLAALVNEAALLCMRQAEIQVKNGTLFGGQRQSDVWEKENRDAQ
jgi:ATP-dependent 26S proteasome regulatory subunit